MRSTTRALWLATAAVALLLALWLVLGVAVVGSTLTPAEQAAVTAVLQPRAALLVMGWIFAVAAAAWVIHGLLQRHVAAPARLAERTRALLSGRSALAREPRAPAYLVALEDAIQSLAEQRDALRDDMAREVARAAGEIEEERDQLVALLAGMGEAVVVCNLDGRIALYNARARLQFRTLSDAGLSPDGELVGVGRSVFGVFRRELVEHALDEIRLRLARGAASPLAQFVTVTRGGQLLRVTVAPVHTEAASPGDGLRGFVLTMVNLTRIQDEVARRDQALLAVHEGLRGPVRGVSAAVQRLTGDAAASPVPQPALDALQSGVQALEQQLSVLAREAAQAGQAWQPLQDMLGLDLLAAAQARLPAHCGCPVQLGTVDEGLWLRVDSYMLLQALGHLARRVSEALDVKFFSLRLTPRGEYGVLDLVWQGAAISTETVMNWQIDAMAFAGEAASLTVRDVVARHGSELGFERDRVRHEAYFRWVLHRGGMHVHAAAEGGADHDLSLLQAGAPMSTADDAQLSALTFTVFDTETTGLNPSGGDAVIQLGAVRIVNGRLLATERIDQLVDPQRDIPAASVQVHGITPEQVRGKPRFAEVLPAFHAFAHGSVLVAHNAAFDMKLLQMQEEATGLRFTQPVLDTMLLSAVAQPNQASHTLDAIAQRLGVEVQGRHSALGDALTTAEVFLRLIPLLEGQGVHTLAQAIAASSRTRHARVSY